MLASMLAIQAGADFIKTSTGFSTGDEQHSSVGINRTYLLMCCANIISFVLLCIYNIRRSDC